MIVFERRPRGNQSAGRFLYQDFENGMRNNCFVNAEEKALKTMSILANLLFFRNVLERKLSFLALNVAFCVMFIAGMQRAKYWKQLHGKNLTIKFECGVILGGQ